MKNEVRTPVQERAILKKKRIIDASYRLFSKVGYYNTNTAEIAKEAGVSTGIVYGYFKDKRDILLDVLDVYVSDVVPPFLQIIDETTLENIGDLVPKMVDAIIKTHEKHQKIHEALHSLTATDKEVKDKFIAIEDAITYKLSSKFDEIGYGFPNKMERIHFAINVTQAFSHEYVYDKHDYIDYEVMKQVLISVVNDLIKR